jgi:hypothetical protein
MYQKARDSKRRNKTPPRTPLAMIAARLAASEAGAAVDVGSSVGVATPSVREVGEALRVAED